MENIVCAVAPAVLQRLGKLKGDAAVPDPNQGLTNGRGIAKDDCRNRGTVKRGYYRSAESRTTRGPPR